MLAAEPPSHCYTAVMTQRQPCSSCGALILPDTATKNGGLRMPCKRGYRKSIEESKLFHAEQRKQEQSAERKHWLALVDRVHGTPGGFDQLNSAERTYFAVSCLIGEVYNGGFEQFFSNSSGSLYGYALDGLVELGAAKSVALLAEAKRAIFGDGLVPLDRQDRFNKMLTNSEEDEASSQASTLLDSLDKQFWKDEDGLAELCAGYAVRHKLYSKD
ncbi:MAG: DMP19 family protein [Burkholderiales bacterium]